MNRLGYYTLAALAGLAAPAGAMAASVTHYHADLGTFYTSTSGSADFTLDGNLLTVHLTLNGVDALQDHLVHINGFAGTAQASVNPGPAQDTDSGGNLFIEANEAESAYGPAILNLATLSSPTHTVEFTQAYDLGDNSIFNNSYTQADLLPLELREIVVDGGTTSTNPGNTGSGLVRGFQSDPNDGTYDATVPVAWGEIEQVRSAAVPLPAAFWPGAGMLLGLGGLTCLRRRRTPAA